MKRFIASGVAILSLASPAFAFAEDGSSSSVRTKAEIKAELKVRNEKHKAEIKAEIEARKARKQVNGACMQTAVDKRDNAVLNAVKTQSEAWVKALEARRDALKAAWGMTDESTRKEAIRAAWKKYRGDRKAIREKFRTDRKAAWKQFKTDAKACGGTGSGDEGSDSDDDL